VDLVNLLAHHGFTVRDVDLFAVAAGPGSFTGLRIGIATMQGLAFACGRPVAAVSALDALALLGASQVEDTLVAAWVDAQRDEVFSALYRCGANAQSLDGTLDVVDAAAVGPPSRTLQRWMPLIAGRRVRFIGTGACAYRDLVVEAVGEGVDVVEPSPALAPAIARIAGHRAAGGLAGLPHAVKPLYVRRPDAELARDKRTTGG
jgi:tRNA threonylcarbamoyladenosine biosynthesis protein TsaB